MTHLDTSFLIRGLAPGSPEDRRIRAWLHAGETLAISAIAWTEYLCRPLNVDQIELAERLLQEPIPLTAADAALSAELFNRSGRRRGSLVDCLIAASAIRSGATLATANAADFRRLAPAGLTLAEV